MMRVDKLISLCVDKAVLRIQSYQPINLSTYQPSSGVALLQALIMVNLMALTAAALMILTLGGYTSVVQVEKSLSYRGAAEAALSLAYQDLECFDPDFNGIWTACAARYCKPGFFCTAGCKQDPAYGGACYGDGSFVGPSGIWVDYSITLPGGAAIDIPTKFSFDSSSYSVSATPPEFN